MRRTIDFPAFLFSLFILPFLANAHEGEPPVPAGQVAINFALPEMDGTISLGIYDAAGKLVRVLHREAAEGNFVKGLNGLITHWDGKTDSGKEVSPGKFFARGYVVGDVQFEGEAYHFNDWIEGAEAPRIRRITYIRALPDGALRIDAGLSGGAVKAFIRNAEGKLAPTEFRESMDGALAVAIEGKIGVLQDHENIGRMLEGVEWAIDAKFDSAGNLWVIDAGADGFAVKQIAPEGELLRRLAITRGEPVPVRVSPAPDTDALYLLEENTALQRVRKLTLDAAPVEGEPAVSQWRSSLLGEFRFSDKLEQVRDGLVTAAEKKIDLVPMIRVGLVANPLQQEEKPSAEVGVGVEKGGSFLQLADGLPLRRVSATAGLKWAAIGREEGDGPVTIFQSDGAVVEEFTARGLEKMIAIDAGELEFPPLPVKPDARNGEL